MMPRPRRKMYLLRRNDRASQSGRCLSTQIANGPVYLLHVSVRTRLGSLIRLEAVSAASRICQVAQSVIAMHNEHSESTRTNLMRRCPNEEFVSLAALDLLPFRRSGRGMHCRCGAIASNGSSRQGAQGCTVTVRDAGSCSSDFARARHSPFDPQTLIL